MTKKLMKTKNIERLFTNKVTNHFRLVCLRFIKHCEKSLLEEINEELVEKLVFQELNAKLDERKLNNKEI